MIIFDQHPLTSSHPRLKCRRIILSNLSSIPQTAFLLFLALFATSPIFSTCIVSLLYSVYLFVTNESSSFHHAQEFENRFWTIFAVLFSTAFFFAKDSPFAFGRGNPTLGFLGVVFMGYAMHAWDRYVHRKEIGRGVNLRRGVSVAGSLNKLSALGMSVEEKLESINACLADIDQRLLPSTINNYINQRFVLRKEKEVIAIFEEAQPKELNYLVSHVQLGLLFYKIKDHRNFAGQHRTELIEMLAVDRISSLTVISRVIVLHALMIMKLPANAKSEQWVRNIIISTHQDDLSELKTLTDSKGDYFSMNKLIYDDLRSETVRQDILTHIRKEASIQEAHMQMGTKKAKLRLKKAWRKVLSDVDDTLTSSGGSYPAGIDKRFLKRSVYPGCMGFYRELDLGTNGPLDWPNNTVGNLVFLSARPHLYKDVSERHNFAKFEKLRARGAIDIRRGLHTIPSLLAGDLTSGRDFIVNDDMEPLALKKFDNFKRFVSIYPEFNHVFICDNGQGDVRAGELMFDAFPKHLEAVYVHRVKEIHKTHGYDGERYLRKSYAPYFFRTYADAALHAATRDPPLIKLEGMRRICEDAVSDFYAMTAKEWTSMKQKAERRDDLNQDVWKVNQYLEELGEEPVAPVEAERLWKDDERVRTPYGIGVIRSFDPAFDLYEVELDWRPVDVQVADHTKQDAKARKKGGESPSLLSRSSRIPDGGGPMVLETVVEATDENDDGSSEASDTNPLNDSDVFQSSIRDQLERVSEHVDANEENSSDTSIIEATPSVISEDSSIGATSFPSDSISVDTTTTQQEEIDETGDIDAPFSPAESAGSVLSNAKAKKPTATFSRPVIAKVQGKLIQKYSPPKPPVLTKEDKTRQSIFSFWVDEAKKTEPFKPGDKCTTLYGPATVIEYRSGKRIVVVEMIGWKAKAYLRENDVKKVVSEGIWNSLMRTLYSSETKDATAVAPPKQKDKGLEFPHAIGTMLQTPYGEGVVSRPLPVAVATSPSRISPGSAPSTPKRTILGPKSTTRSENTPTLEVTLTMWHLANESSAKVYCTVEQARAWKKAHDDKSKSGDNVLTVVGGLLSRGLKRMASSVEKTPKKSHAPSAQIEEIPAPPRVERYYQNGASVTTSFGDGIVLGFRESDGFYKVKLEKWGSAVAYLRRDDLSYRLAEGCHEGYPVLTSLGLSGTLESVQPTTGVHVVTIPATNMVCYLQPNDVVQPLKAAKSEDVATRYGEGIVLKYRQEDDMYVVKLKSFSNATLYCRAETFDRIADVGSEGSSGLSWFLKYLFFASDDAAAAPVPAPASSSRSRSRSNSIVSARSGSTSTSKAAK